MVFDWRTHRYRGGSGWLQPAVVMTYVGITLGSIPALPDDILQTSVSYAEPDRSVTCEAPLRSIAFTHERTVTFDG